MNEQTDRQQGEASKMQTETKRIGEECCEMDRRNEEDGEEMLALNMQIKSVLAKVSY